MEEKNRNRIALLLLLAGAIFVTIGIMRGEVATVLKKAVMVCLECMGIG